MPIYEFECKTCEHVFEKIVLKNTDNVEDFTCPKCGSFNFDRIMSKTTFRLKGSGWYATDYANYNNEKGGNDE